MIDWTKLLLSACKSVNHVKLLRELYDGKVILKDLSSVNYKTACRIMNKYREQGLVCIESTKRGNAYSLTNKGKLIACIVLGEFKDIRQDLEFKPLFNKEGVYVERADVVQEVLHNLGLKRNTLLIGPSGIGKTTLLKQLIDKHLTNALLVNSRPPSHILESLAGHYGVSLRKGSRKKRINELLKDVLELVGGDLILIVDEIEDLTKRSTKILKKLMREDLLVLGAGTCLKKDLPFNIIKLRPLSKDETSNLVQQLLKEELDELPSELISHLTNRDSKPEDVSNACKEVRIRHEKGELKTKDLIKQQYKPLKRVNLLSKYGLINLGYLLITLRYVFYSQREYQIGYTLSTIAYLLFFLFRRRRRKK